MQRGDQGPKVQALQQALLSHGYRLPRFGADGDFGGETVRAVLDLAKDAKVIWPQYSDVPETLLDELGIGEVDDIEDEPCVGPSSDIDLEGVTLYDLRDRQVEPHPKGRANQKTGRTVRRLPSAITGVTLHQMGVPFGVADGWDDDFETYEEALAQRGLGIACHAAVFRPGFLVLPADPLAYIKHANALNPSTFGLEVDGLYPGLIGRRTLKGKPPNDVTDELVHGARMGLKLLVHLGRTRGCPIEFVWGHRQADSWRQADPGEELWRKVVVEYAVPVLGLKTRTGDAFAHYKGPRRRGLPIPVSWDPNGVGSY